MASHQDTKTPRREDLIQSCQIAVDDATDAFLERGSAKIHQDAERKIEQAQIGQHLFAMDRRESLHRFELDDQFAINKQIGAKSFIKCSALISERDRKLPLDQKPSLFDGVRKDRFVHRFEQTRTETLMKPEPAIDDETCHFINIHINSFLVSLCLRVRSSRLSQNYQ